MTAELYVDKRDFRRMVWDQLLESQLVKAERSINRNRLPNFMGNEEAADRVCEMDEFKSCRTIVINRDTAQQPICLRALKAGKDVYVPNPHNRYGSYSRLLVPSIAADSTSSVTSTNGAPCTPQQLTDQQLLDTVRGVGSDRYSTQMAVDQLPHIDMFVVGAMAVSKQGYRIGQGDGFSDMDYAVIRTAGHITDDTLVVTTVHDDQVFDRLPSELFGAHDVAIDVIGTPSRLLYVEQRLDKPAGIIWSLIAPRRLQSASIIRSLMEKQQADGVEVKLSDECADVLPHRRADSNTGSTRHSNRGAVPGAHTRFYSRSNRRRSNAADRQQQQQQQPSRDKSVDVDHDDIHHHHHQNGAAVSDGELVSDRGGGGGRYRRGGGGRGRRGRNSGRRTVSTSEVADTQRHETRIRRARCDNNLLVLVRLIPFNVRVSEMKRAVEQLAGCSCIVLSFNRHRSLLRLESPRHVQDLLEHSDRLSIGGHSVLIQAVTDSPRPPSSHRLTDGRHVHVTGVPGVAGQPPPLSRIRSTLHKMGFEQTEVFWYRQREQRIEFIDGQTARQFVDSLDRVRQLISPQVELRIIAASDGEDQSEPATRRGSQLSVVKECDNSTSETPDSTAMNEDEVDDEKGVVTAPLTNGEVTEKGVVTAPLTNGEVTRQVDQQQEVKCGDVPAPAESLQNGVCCSDISESSAASDCESKKVGECEDSTVCDADSKTPSDDVSSKKCASGDCSVDALCVSVNSLSVCVSGDQQAVSTSDDVKQIPPTNTTTLTNGDVSSQ